MKFSWNPVTSYVFKGLIMGQILFSIFIIDLDDESAHSAKSEVPEKLGGAHADELDVCAVIQRDLNRLKE